MKELSVDEDIDGTEPPCIHLTEISDLKMPGVDVIQNNTQDWLNKPNNMEIGTFFKEKLLVADLSTLKPFELLNDKVIIYTGNKYLSVLNFY